MQHNTFPRMIPKRDTGGPRVSQLMCFKCCKKSEENLVSFENEFQANKSKTCRSKKFYINKLGISGH